MGWVAQDVSSNTASPALQQEKMELNHDAPDRLSRKKKTEESESEIAYSGGFQTFVRIGGGLGLDISREGTGFPEGGD